MDHERINVNTTRMSCGVMELSRVNDDTSGVLYALAARLYHPSRGDPCAFFVFSDVSSVDGTASEELANIVSYNKQFGTITRSPQAENPKTGNHILIYIWTIDHEKFKAWYAKKRVEKISKVGT